MVYNYMTRYGYIIMIIVDSCMIWFHFDSIMKLKISYHIAIIVCSRKSVLSFGDFPDCIGMDFSARKWKLLSHIFYDQ